MSIKEKSLLLKEDFDEVYEAGKTKEWSDFWDSAQVEGQRTNYDRSFKGYMWTDVTFKPKYDIKLTHATQCFMYSQFTDIKAILERCGVSLITDGTGNYSQLFSYSKVTHIPELNISKASSTSNMFNGASSLVSIDKLIVVENTAFENAFTYTSSLKDISFEGVIGTDISFSSSPLSVGSLKNIIEHLKDFSGGNEYSKTVTFKASSFSALEAEGTTAEYNGAACTWAELIGYKKWNLVKA